MNAREAALESLLDRRGNVSAHLERVLAQGVLSPRDAALATELACGVVRRQRTLDAVLRAHADKPGKTLPQVVRTALRLGAYQILFLDRVPDHAAVSESVETVNRRHRRFAGFVNAVLRNIARQARREYVARLPLDPSAVPVSPNEVCHLDMPVMASPEEAPVGFLGEACSLPDDLAERWLRRSSDLGHGLARCMHVNARPPVVLRVDTSRMPVAEALERLAGQGVEAVAHENGASLVLTGHADPGSLELFQEGVLTAQDATGTAAVDALDVQPGMNVLDFCAAPGAKTTRIGEKLRGRGTITAVDVNEEKLQLIRQSMERCGVAKLVECRLAATVGSLPLGGFDRVLVDAPCSNTGVLARRVEARWRFDAARLGMIASDQRHILAMAAMFLAEGGRLVYSTCSLEPEENDQVVQAFLRRNGKHRLLEQKYTQPHGFCPPGSYRDGGYYAVLSA